MLKYNLSQIESLSKKILVKLSKSDCIFLFGELGSGKTTFVRTLIHMLQEKNKIPKTEVLSPTFSLLHEYQIKSIKIMHYDLYRLNKNKDIDQLAIFEKIDKQITLIEWPERLKNMNISRLEITFYYDDKKDYRKIRLKGFGKWKNFKLNAI